MLDEKSWPEPLMEKVPAITRRDRLLPLAWPAACVIVFPLVHFTQGLAFGSALVLCVALGLLVGCLATVRLVITFEYRER